MWPLAVDASANAAYVLKKLDGRFALYRVALDGSMKSELVRKHERVDVDGVVRLGTGGPVIGLTYAEDMRHVSYFEPEYARLAASLGKALGQRPIVDFVGASVDGGKLLIRAGSDVDPGRYYVFDRKSSALNEILLARPALENVPLAKVKPITYPAGDGVLIPGYLTLPPGKESARDLPAIVVPHGGPSARDEWGFDWLPQYFANRGYAVIQPNFRGSQGYGDDWMMENGFRAWKTSIGDVASAGRWLVKEGIADPRQLAIVGWSYGGYAALQVGATEPDLFGAIVAIAPVTDLGMLKDDERRYTHGRNVAEYVGSGPHVAEGSPLRNVDRFKAPILMFHGTDDINVAIGQSREMQSRLESAGKTSELVVYDGLDHSLVDSAVRTQMLLRMTAFLESALKR